MERAKFKKFIKQSLSQQGSASAVVLGQLAQELLNHIPYVIHIGDLKEDVSTDTTMYYDITNSQDEINEIIKEVMASETPYIVVHDKGVTLHFDHIEYDNTSVICYLEIEDGIYSLSLSPTTAFSILTFQKNS